MDEAPQSLFVDWLRAMEKNYDLQKLMTPANGQVKTFTNLLDKKRPLSWGNAIATALRATRAVLGRFGPDVYIGEWNHFFRSIFGPFEPALHLMPRILADANKALASKNAADEGWVYQRFSPPIAFFSDDIELIATLLASQAIERQAHGAADLKESLCLVLDHWRADATVNFFGKYHDRRVRDLRARRKSARTILVKRARA